MLSLIHVTKASKGLSQPSWLQLVPHFTWAPCSASKPEVKPVPHTFQLIPPSTSVRAPTTHAGRSKCASAKAQCCGLQTKRTGNPELEGHLPIRNSRFVRKDTCAPAIVSALHVERCSLGCSSNSHLLWCSRQKLQAPACCTSSFLLLSRRYLRIGIVAIGYLSWSRCCMCDAKQNCSHLWLE